MLTIFNLLKKNNKIIRTYNEQGQSIGVHKRNIPSNKEWYNSVYCFDKNSIRFLPSVHTYVFKLLRGYFNMVSEKMEIDVTARKYKKLRRSSGNKVWIGTPEIKHLNDRLTITVYVYNRIYNLYKSKLDSLEFTWGPRIKEIRYIDDSDTKKVTVKPTKIVNVQTSDIQLSKDGSDNISNSLGYTYSHKNLHDAKSRFYSTKVVSNDNKKKTGAVVFFNRKLRAIRQEYPMYLGKNKSTAAENYYSNVINWLRWNKLSHLLGNKSDIVNANGAYNTDLLEKLTLVRLERYNYLINLFRKELIYFRFKQKLLFNQFKLSEVYLNPLTNFLQMIYKKKVELNIIVLKNYYLNSSILLQIIETKLKKSQARGRHLITVDRAMSRLRIPTLSGNKLQRLEKRNVDMQNVILDNSNIKNSKDSLNQFLLTNNSPSTKNIHKLVLKNLENKSMAGLFIKISGRLTKRYKAQRAVSTLREKGTLKNVHSAHTGLPSALSRGYSNINVDKTMLFSKNRIGAYGLTGWIASY